MVRREEGDKGGQWGGKGKRGQEVNRRELKGQEEEKGKEGRVGREKNHKHTIGSYSHQKALAINKNCGLEELTLVGMISSRPKLKQVWTTLP